MSMFEGFETFDFNEGVPYVSVTKNGITFNKSVIMKLGYPEYVVLLLNQESKVIAIKKCSESTPKSVAFHKKNERNVLSVRWNARDLLNTILDMTKWDLTFDAYKIDGILVKEEEAMIFDLTQAKKL